MDWRDLAQARLCRLGVIRDVFRPRWHALVCPLLPNTNQNLKALPADVKATLSDLCIAAKTPSFDHLVGAGEEHRRNGEAKRQHGLEIDHWLEGGRLFDRESCWILTLENATQTVTTTSTKIR